MSSRQPSSRQPSSRQPSRQSRRKIIPTPRTRLLIVVVFLPLLGIISIYLSISNLIALNQNINTSRSTTYTAISYDNTAAVTTVTSTTDVNTTATTETKQQQQQRIIRNNNNNNNKRNNININFSHQETINIVPVEFFDNDYYANHKCFINIINSTFIGCGFQGQTFLTQMECSITTTTTIPSEEGEAKEEAKAKATTSTTTTINTTITRRQQVILKIGTTILKNNKHGYKVLSGSHREEMSNYKRMNELLFPSSSSAAAPNNATITTTTSNNNNNNDNDNDNINKMNNNMNNNMRQHFHLPLGKVKIHVHQLYSTLHNNITEEEYKCDQLLNYQYVIKKMNQQQNLQNQQQQEIDDEIEIDEDDNDDNTNSSSLEYLQATATIQNVAKGELIDAYLNKFRDHNNTNSNSNSNNNNIPQQQPNNNAKPKRILFIKQLICIWKHMYQHYFIHDDMQRHHIYFDESIVSLIDFQHYIDTSEFFYDNSNYDNVTTRLLKLDDNISKNYAVVELIKLEIIQLYQLIVFIANICMVDYDYMGDHIPRSMKSTLKSTTIKTVKKKKKKSSSSSSKNQNQQQQQLLQNHSADDFSSSKSKSSKQIIVNNKYIIVNKDIFVTKLQLALSKCEEEIMSSVVNTTSNTTTSNNNISINTLPSLFFDYYYEILFTTNPNNNVTTTTTATTTDTSSNNNNTSNNNNNNKFNVYVDNDNEIIGQFYDILSQWANGGGGNGSGC